MRDWLQTIFVVMIVADFALLASSRIAGCINILALQGVMLSVLPLLNHASASALFFASLIFSIKALAFPFLLRRALRMVDAKREVEPLVGYSASILIGLAALVFSFWLSGRVGSFSPGIAILGVSASIFTMFAGLFVMVSRIKAITQVVGYVVFENGIYLLGSSLMLEQNMLVELGVILDLLVFVLLSGIVVFHINREFDHIDTDSMDGDDAVREAPFR